VTPELLQTYSLPIGAGIALLIVLGVGPLRRALLAMYKGGYEQGQAAGRALSGAAEPAPRPERTNASAQTSPAHTFGRKR
jgi:hypothetical protein